MGYPDGGGLTVAGQAKREAVRLDAAGMFADGASGPQVAAHARVSRQSGWRWQKAFQDGGVQALRSKGPHRRCRLSEQQIKALTEALEEGPAAHGWTEDQRWTLARIEQGMTRSTDAERARAYRRRRKASWLKVSLAGFLGVAVLGLGGLAVAAGVKQLAPQHPAAVGTPTSQGSVATSESHAPATKPAVQTPESPAPSTRHSAPPAADGPIAAHGTIDVHSTVYWEQNDLTVDVTQPLNALTVELRVAQSTGVQSTGSWQTAPPDDFTVSVTQTQGYLVYRWTLKPGRTVPAARQIFAAQFNHHTGKRDASKDTFLVESTAAGRTAAVRGGFAPGG